MTPADVARLTAAKGETIVLRREGAPNVDVTVKAFVTGFAPSELVGDIKQGDRKVVIANAEIVAAAWPGPPRIGDRAIIGGKTFTIGAPDTRKMGDEICGHWMVARG